MPEPPSTTPIYGSDQPTMSGYTVVLGGRYGVGKTSLFLRLTNIDAPRTRGADKYVYRTTVNGKPLEVKY